MDKGPARPATTTPGIDRTFTFDASARGRPLHLRKYLVYHSYGPDDERGSAICPIASPSGRWTGRSSSLLRGPARRPGEPLKIDEYWRGSATSTSKSKAKIDQNVAPGRCGSRCSRSSNRKASALTDSNGIPAKVFTGQGYGGHYFWDMEAYVLHVAHLDLAPGQARVVSVRYRPIRRFPRPGPGPRELNKAGALFPWRTINGEEASSFFPAGTAEYHINGDIAHAVRHYCEVSGDDDFLFDQGYRGPGRDRTVLVVDLGFFHNPGGGRVGSASTA